MHIAAVGRVCIYILFLQNAVKNNTANFDQLTLTLLDRIADLLGKTQLCVAF
jgi:hypothetical protein